MTDETQEQMPEKPTLEELYAEFETPVPTPQEQPPVAPAPKGNEAAILKEVNALKAQLEAEKQARTREQENKDFEKAVAKLAKVSGLEGKKTSLKGFLLGKASEDERLRNLWENRQKHPKTWDSALELLAEEAKSEFTIVDPQLDENQRAMNESQRRASATAPASPSEEDKFMKMGQGEFDRAWHNLIRG